MTEANEELRIKYSGFDRKLEERLDALLKRYGWHWWASGYNLLSGVRTICYER